jgi:hypothetical protein
MPGDKKVVRGLANSAAHFVASHTSGPKLFVTTIRGARISLRLACQLWCALCVFWIPMASAKDNKAYNGTECVPTRLTDDVSYVNGSVLTISKSVSVDCPIVRDNTENRNGLVTVEVIVRIDSDLIFTNKSYGCDLQAFDLTGDPFGNFPFKKLVSISFENVYVSTDNLGKVMSLDFDGPSKLKTSDLFGKYLLTCLLPPASAILSYLVIEP